MYHDDSLPYPIHGGRPSAAEKDLAQGQYADAQSRGITLMLSIRETAYNIKDRKSVV